MEKIQPKTMMANRVRPNFQISKIMAAVDFSAHIKGGITVLHICCCFCLVAKSCQTLCNCTDCRPPGSSVHGVLWAKLLEWIAISFSRAFATLD